MKQTYIIFLFLLFAVFNASAETTTITFVKGGQTEANQMGVWQGQKSNPDLTETAEKSLEELKEQLQNKGFQIAYSDALLRTSKTAKKILENYPNAKLVMHEGLTVRKIDPFEGKNQKEVMQIYQTLTGDLKPRSADEIFETNNWIEGIESNDQLLQRMQNFIKEMSQGEYRNILAVTHTDNFRVLLRSIHQLDSSADFKVLPNAILVIELKDGKVCVKAQEGISRR